MGRSNFSHHTSGKQRDGEMDLIFHLRLSMMYIGHVQLRSPNPSEGLTEQHFLIYSEMLEATQQKEN